MSDTNASPFSGGFDLFSGMRVGGAQVFTPAVESFYFAVQRIPR
jgi:hypothetical protein